MQLIVRVFVSSTWLDLQPERAAVEKALQRMRQTKLNGMEYFGSGDKNTRDVSLAELDRSDVYVGIIGGRYGSGITEEEYHQASKKNMPRLIYFKKETNIPTNGRDPEEAKQTRLVSWKEELREAHTQTLEPFTSPDNLAAKVTADLSNLLLERYGAKLYLEGISSLPFDYYGRIENFLTEYLGTSKVPGPFGGREKDLKALDAWLEDPATPPYLMIAAPAGRGKSALLVRWSRQLLARPNIALVFVPISIRFRTNLSSVTFAALAARLAQLHGDKMPDTPSTSVETWRGLVTEYFRRPLASGEKLLVVLDGLDEAADWEASPDLFPLNPHDQIRVVVSARHRAGDEDARAWLRRLGWERQHLAKLYDLETLNKEGVAQVLKSMGFPLSQLGAKVDIVAELYRLSEGDPLLVRLYVDDLWTHKEIVGSLKPEDLRKLKPGLKGYFDRWWTDQRTLWGKESPLKVQAVQTLLSVLACSLGPLDQEGLRGLTKLSFWDLLEALKPLDRFIIGDGRIHGYAFSHPRLGDYFKDALSASEQQAWQQRFLDWGKETVQALEDGSLPPAKAPAYIVQYYGAHLEQAHVQTDALLTLVCQGWSKAWEALEGSFSGFLNDVERAWKAAERENEQAITNSEAAPRIANEIRCALVRASINSLAENLPVELLVKLVRHQKWTVTQGLSYARQIPEDDRRTYALVRLATELEIPRDLRDQIFLESLSATETFSESQYLTSILTTLAPHLPEAVLAAIPTLIHSEDRVRILMALAPYQPEAVVAAIPGLTEEWQRAQILIALGPHRPDAVVAALPSLEDIKERATVLIALAPYRSETVLAEAMQIGKSDARAQVLTALAPYRPEEVWDEIPALKDHVDRVKALIALAPHLPKAVLTALPLLVYSEGRVEVMIALAPYEPEAVLAALPNITGSNDRLELLTALAPHKPEAVLAAARELSYGWQRDHVLGALTPHQPETVAAVRAIKDWWKRAQVLTALSTNRTEVIVAALKMVDTTEELVQVLASLAPHHPDAVLSALPTLLCDQDRIPVLTALVPYKPEAVLAIVRRIQDNEEWVTIFSAMTPYQSESVLAAVPMFKDNKDRIRILMTLAPHQSQAVLAAVPTLQDSKDRVKILTTLAPYQSQEVLAAAPTFKDSNDRIKILTALA
ncbi:MAG: DUF4062 domain-containing protein [Nitrospira sp.]|nr:DUF4062 domain-containing protein [Nitrospira sp.]